MTVPGARPAVSPRQGLPVQDDGQQRTAALRAPATAGDRPLPRGDAPPGGAPAAPGCVVHGTFEAYGRVGDEPAAVFTRAALFQQGGRRTPVTVRFAPAVGGHDAEAVRGPRCFAVGFRTAGGGWELVGSTLPVHAARDAARCADVLRAFRPDPVTRRPHPDRLFGLLSATPAAMHLLTWVYSPRGIPANHRTQDGYGVETYRMVNAAGGGVLVKYHWRTQQGVASLTAEQAERIRATEPHHASRDLAEAIARGEHPRWELNVQVMSDDGHPGLDFDPLDTTKTWPEETFPLRPVGMLTLDRGARPGDGAPVPGSGSAATVDGLDVPAGGTRRLPWERASDYGQAGARFRAMPAWERDDLVRNLVAALGGCDGRVQAAMVRHLGRCDEAYGRRVAEGLGLGA